MPLIGLIVGVMLLAIAGRSAPLAQPAAAPAGQPPDTIIVFDASNSMWGRIDGRPKIVIAREAVGGLIGRWPPGGRIGLVAYGHRRAGDCRDIEVLQRPMPADAAAMRARLEALSPRGRTPLTEAVREAAQVLGAADRPARIVLVSDGIETCGGDPCQLGAALRAARADLMVHIIGFGLRPDEGAQLRCLAEATGGQYLPADNAAQLLAALQAATGAAAAPEPRPPRPPPPRAAGPTNLTLEALDVEGGRIVETILWSLESAEEPPRVLLDNHGGHRPQLAVPAGRYRVRALSGNARIEESFDVAGPAQTHRVVLNVGRLRLAGALAPGAPPGIDGLWYLIADEVPGFAAGDEVVADLGDAVPELILTQGSYRVRFRRGAAWAEADVHVAAARVQALRLDLQAAEVRLEARRGGASVDAGLWEVHELAADGSRTEVAGSGAAVLETTLPAGRYVARAFVADVWHEATFEVRAGGQARVVVPVR